MHWTYLQGCKRASTGDATYVGSSFNIIFDGDDENFSLYCSFYAFDDATKDVIGNYLVCKGL